MLIELYTKPGCPECNRTKKVLAQYQIPYKEFVLGENITREEVKAKFPDAKYVPIILVDGVESGIDNLKLLLEANLCSESSQDASLLLS